MHGLAPTNPQYAVLYAQCAALFPSSVQDFPAPILQNLAFSFQQQPALVQGTVNPLPNSTFLPPPHQPDGCAFCAQYGHCIQDCPMAHDYMQHSLAVMYEGQIRLPNYALIPNDSTGRGLKISIDAWHATQVQSTTQGILPHMTAPGPPPLPTAPFQ